MHLRSYISAILVVLIFASSCAKNETNTGGGGFQPTPVIKVPKAPVARAGMDTTIYPLISSALLNGTASSDSDGSSLAYKWLYLGNNPSISLSGSQYSIADARELIIPGVYEFELSVTDADNLVSKDTIKITVGSPDCTSALQEIIVSNMSWNTSWIMELNIFKPSSMLPPGSRLKKIFIKRDASSSWVEVFKFNPNNPDYTNHTWDYGYETLAIYPANSNLSLDTPDLKLVYCN